MHGRVFWLDSKDRSENTIKLGTQPFSKQTGIKTVEADSSRSGIFNLNLLILALVSAMDMMSWASGGDVSCQIITVW